MAPRAFSLIALVAAVLAASGEVRAASLKQSATLKWGNNAEGTCVAVDGTVSDPGDGSRVALFKDNSSTPGAPSSGYVKLYSKSGEFYMRSNSSGEAALYRAGGTDVAVADGGTGASTATAGFNALDPLTTKGDALAHNGTDSVRVAVGANGSVYVADSAQSAGVKFGYDPTAWTAAVTGSDWTKATTGMGSVTGLSYTITQSVNYLITGHFRLNASAGTADPEVRFNVSGTGPTVLIGFHCANEGSTAINSWTQTSATGSNTITTGAATTWSCMVSGRITGPTSGGNGTGTLDVGPTNTGTDTVYIGSYLTVQAY